MENQGEPYLTLLAGRLATTPTCHSVLQIRPLYQDVGVLAWGTDTDWTPELKQPFLMITDEDQSIFTQLLCHAPHHPDDQQHELKGVTGHLDIGFADTERNDVPPLSPW